MRKQLKQSEANYLTKWLFVHDFVQLVHPSALPVPARGTGDEDPHETVGENGQQ